MSRLCWQWLGGGGDAGGGVSAGGVDGGHGDGQIDGGRAGRRDRAASRDQHLPNAKFHLSASTPSILPTAPGIGREGDTEEGHDLFKATGWLKERLLSRVWFPDSVQSHHLQYDSNHYYFKIEHLEMLFSHLPDKRKSTTRSNKSSRNYSEGRFLYILA